MCRRGGAPGSTIGRRVTDVAMGAAADEFVLEEVAFTVREQTNSARRPCVIYQEITFDKPANVRSLIRAPWFSQWLLTLSPDRMHQV